MGRIVRSGGDGINGKPRGVRGALTVHVCGGRGIRTLDSGLNHYDGLANRCLQPLGHPSVRERKDTEEA